VDWDEDSTKSESASETALKVAEQSIPTKPIADTVTQTTAESKQKPPRAPGSLRAFLCHSSSDKAAVRQLYHRLQEEGVQPWLDEEDILPGRNWEREIQKAVRNSDLILVCLSKGSLTKEGYLHREMKDVLDVADQQPEDAIFVIPLKLEECDVPDRLRKWQWVNLFDERGYERLLRALRARADELGVTLTPQAKPQSPAPVAQAPVVAVKQEPAKAPSPISAPPKGHSTDFLVIESPIRLELVRVPAGEFLMGSDPARDKDARTEEQPQHKVYVSEFYIGKYPITNAQYAAYARAKSLDFKAPEGKGNHPVVNVSWDDAVAFCEWLSAQTYRLFRLPTEAQWEKAARGTDGRIFPWGDQYDKNRANVDVGFFKSFTSATTPVGKYSPAGDSPYGAADMAGNVWEWCADWYDGNEYEQRVQSCAPIKDPTGPLSGTARVLRGGAFFNYAALVRCARRVWGNPLNRNVNNGFRVRVLPI
jgi:formylglycine-generating enzyme required for sulfatase activity